MLQIILGLIGSPGVDGGEGNQGLQGPLGPQGKFLWKVKLLCVNATNYYHSKSQI